MQFLHSVFWQNKTASLSYFSLVMSFVSLWIKKSPLLWVTFLFIAIILALDAHILSYIALYNPSEEKGFCFNDPAIGIVWPDLPSLISEKDRSSPWLEEVAL